MSKPLKFSIVIPAEEINNYVLETCQKLDQLELKNFEILIFPDGEGGFKGKMETVPRVIATGKISPAAKRDLALKYARGKYLAFIDDDAYPTKDWLRIAKRGLESKEVAAVGGPQLTPPSDSFWQKVSGAVFLSPLSGSALIRYWPGKKVQEVDDWPTVNFIVKRDVFEKIGGFDSAYWPGEDTKLCLDILKLKKKILYLPDLRVYHHRRAGLLRHLKQIGNYGLHRGYFARKFPQTSKRFMYFIPSFFVIGFFLGLILSFFSGLILDLYLLGLVIYLFSVTVTTLGVLGKTRDLGVSLMTIPFLILTHFWYGMRFIQGLVFTRELKSKLGR